jgi:16S rRNA (cytosine967-C5)-methyltransferase
LYWILLMGLYQILFLDRVTPYAAVNESVLLCRNLRHQGWMAFANGVLRHVVRARSAPGFARPVYEDLAVEFSHPEWLIGEYRRAFGPEHVREILKWNNKIPQRYARARGDVAALVREVGCGIIEPAPGVGPAMVHVHDMAALIATPAFTAGKFYIMQPWSVHTVAQLPVQDGWNILDMCAAPGGKSLALADAARVQVTALDISPTRIKVIEENARRCQVSTITTRVLDARACATAFEGRQFDAVLLDAPCSNLGVIQRHPEIRWRVQPEMLPAQAACQYELLQSGWQCVKPGGLLLYAVCTVSEQETIDIIERATRALPDLQLQKTELVYPGQRGTDGGFWALFRRK